MPVSHVARIEPPGPAFGRPDDKLREIRERPVNTAKLPRVSLALNPGYDFPFPALHRVGLPCR